MKLSIEGLKERHLWEQNGIVLPEYDVCDMIRKTKKSPRWLHFGGGNIFRAYIAVLQQQLLNKGLEDRGIIVAETFDEAIIDKAYTPFDNLAINVVLGGDGSVDYEVVASIAGTIKPLCSEDEWQKMLDVFTAPELALVSFTVTEKGYVIHQSDGRLQSQVQNDIEKGILQPGHLMAVVAAGLYARYKKSAGPIALVSMDNCSNNGDILKAAVLEIATGWYENGHIEKGFLDYILDKATIAFPCTMIDKITPQPDHAIEQMLAQKGVENMAPVITPMSTYIAPFVNAERTEYLVIEDDFPNGRPQLEETGVYFTDRATVGKAERMKVTTCLNPLHTSMSIFGCLLGYTRVSEEMKDGDILNLIKRLGYIEGLPVVTDPGIISPKAFIDEVVNERLPNPFIPDTPQRIIVDTSQKMGIRFGETIKSYIQNNMDLNDLVAIPLSIAGWLRYLLAIDDQGQPMEISYEPMKEELQALLKGIEWDNAKSYSGQLNLILNNKLIFGLDLTKTALFNKTEGYFINMLAGKGAVRASLKACE